MENKLLALVNGVEINESDIEQSILRFPPERQGYLRTEEGKKQLLEQVISFELIYNYAKEIGLDSNKDYILQVERAKKELLTQSGINEILSKVDVKDDEVKDYYENNKEYFNVEETITAKHILVDTLEEAEKILKEINNGEEFEKLAKEYSKCPSKQQGGSLGAFTKGKMVPEFEEAAFKLEEGQLSDPVKTQFGYHLIKVDKKEPSSIKPLEEVKDIIKNQLLQQNQTKKYVEFTKELRNKYKVEMK